MRAADDPEYGDLSNVVDDGPSLIIEGDLRCLAPEWRILGDTSTLFSSGDLTNCTCKADDFFCFSTGGFGALRADGFRFNSNDFVTSTLLEVACLLICSTALWPINSSRTTSDGRAAISTPAHLDRIVEYNNMLGQDKLEIEKQQ
jgi:hypothetical protein